MTPLPLVNRIHDSSNKRVKFNTIKAEMGDSYTQRAPKGLNPKIDSFAIVWPALDESEKDIVLAVLDSVGAWGILTWTPPGESVSKKFTIDQETGYSIEYIGLRYTISTLINQEFDL